MKTEQIEVKEFELIDGLAFGEIHIGFNSLKSSTFDHAIAKGSFVVKLDGVEPSELARMAGPTLRIHGQKTREVSKDAMDLLNGGTFTLEELDELIGIGDKQPRDAYKSASRKLEKETAGMTAEQKIEHLRKQGFNI